MCDKQRQQLTTRVKDKQTDKHIRCLCHQGFIILFDFWFQLLIFFLVILLMSFSFVILFGFFLLLFYLPLTRLRVCAFVFLVCFGNCFHLFISLYVQSLSPVGFPDSSNCEMWIIFGSTSGRSLKCLGS